MKEIKNYKGGFILGTLFGVFIAYLPKLATITTITGMTLFTLLANKWQENYDTFIHLNIVFITCFIIIWLMVIYQQPITRGRKLSIWTTEDKNNLYWQINKLYPNIRQINVKPPIQAKAFLQSEFMDISLNDWDKNKYIDESEIRLKLENQLTTPFNIEEESSIRLALIYMFWNYCFDPKVYQLISASLCAGTTYETTEIIARKIMNDASLDEAKYKNFCELISELSDYHAWSETVLMSMFETCHQKTNLTTSQFNWLQEIDRPLFMALNAIGRPAYLPEALGVIVHYINEKSQGQPLYKKNVEAGVNGMIAIRNSMTTSIIASTNTKVFLR